MSLSYKMMAGEEIGFMQHYHDEVAAVGGDPCTVTLEHVQAGDRSIELTYRWHEELSFQEADKLDSRLRAFMACAVYDAAVRAGLQCTKGPPHGRRPSWFIKGIPVAFGLQSAGFDADKKWCGLKLGYLLLGPGLDASSKTMKKLAKSFQKHLSELTV